MASVHHKFEAALDALVAEIREDRSILAAVLCGSLAHDTVWARSDIDLLLVTIDDRKVETTERALFADGVNVHASLIPRAEFRQALEGDLERAFLQALVAKGRLLYTHDESITELFGALETLGARDTQARLLRAGTRALGPIYKAHKWLLTRGDLDYTALWILYAATALAQIEVIEAKKLVDREVIPQALALNPRFFKTIYSDLLNARKTKKAVAAALAAVDGYLSSRAGSLFAPVLEHLREAGEARSCTELEDHFARHFGLEGVTVACEYLADQGLIGKASTRVQLTRRSNVSVEELAFFPLSRTSKKAARGR
jgi:predicted nucleotidyltransferase